MNNGKKMMLDMMLKETHFKDLGLTVLRVIFGLFILYHGILKVTDLWFFTQYTEFYNIPAAGLLAPLYAYGQVIVGLLMSLGLFTRLASLAVIIFSFSLIFTVYSIEPIYVKELAMMNFFIGVMFFFVGPGKYSLDKKMLKHCECEIKKQEMPHL